MTAIPARDLRNHTAEVLRRVEAGEEIEVLRDNRPVAKIIPLSRRRQWLPAAEIGHELVRLGPDTTGLAEELRATLTDTTDDLPGGHPSERWPTPPFSSALRRRVSTPAGSPGMSGAFPRSRWGSCGSACCRPRIRRLLPGGCRRISSRSGSRQIG